MHVFVWNNLVSLKKPHVLTFKNEIKTLKSDKLSKS